MKTLYLDLIDRTSDSTLSVLSYEQDGNRYWLAFCLEDAIRKTKIYGKTCIAPNGGTFRIMPRFDGKTFKRTHDKYNTPFALELVNVPNFEGIFLHEFTKISDTLGCILCGKGYKVNGNVFELIDSDNGYFSVFEMVYAWTKDGQHVQIIINRSDDETNRFREVIADYDYQNRIIKPNPFLT